MRQLEKITVQRNSTYWWLNELMITNFFAKLIWRSTSSP
jgi:hypothetical protein